MKGYTVKETMRVGDRRHRNEKEKKPRHKTEDFKVIFDEACDKIREDDNG